MDFKTKFISNIRKVFETELCTKRAHESAKSLLDEFFIDLRDKTVEVSDVALTNFSVDIRGNSYSIKMYDSRLTIDYSLNNIKVTAITNSYGNAYDFNYDPSKFDYLLQGDKSFDEETLHSYVVETFQKPLEKIIGKEVAISTDNI
ncbi:hypothetical protein [Priestia megaterium]|uniref:hypothetical protein n=1 Tax=Priestia megaterium TaxID=1404 RepID=UPI00112C4F6F|nr:hypothetical protein [Priestia megaterium]TPF18447.1 hypothetical protein CBE78_04265 [Priestia megaterium]TPF22557.1 hypothetical protein CBE79_06775 [Priestia megaterium]